MRTWKTIARFRAVLIHPTDKGDLGRSVFIAWCVLVAACCLILLAGSLPSFPLGGSGDFLVTYAAGKIVRDGNGSRLYDLGLQTEVQEGLLAPYHSSLTHGPLPYLHPPFFAAVFVPFTFLPARAACYLWIFVSILILLACVQLLFRRMNANPTCEFPTLLLMVFAYYPVFETLRKGQSSFVLLLAITLTYLSLKQGSNVRAGVALGAALIKPQIACVFAVVLLCKRQWRPLAAFGATALALVIGSWLLVGTGGMMSYVSLTEEALTWDGTHHVYPEVMPNLRGMVHRVMELSGMAGKGLPQSAAVVIPTLMASIGVIALMCRTWRGAWDATSAAFDLRFTQVILGSILLSPYLYWHDLSLLVLAGILLLGHLGKMAKAGPGYVLLAVGHVCAIPLSSSLLGTDISAQIVVLFIAGAMGFILRQVVQRTI